tara:strand:+ start:913 stop:2094 length:1182 start_codon:yes stop_codon:yes gene_type:complete
VKHQQVIAQDLSTALQASCHTSLANAGLKVETVRVDFHGDTASTSWNIKTNAEGERVIRTKITFPYLPANAVLSRYEADVFSGFAAHEMGHNLYTDVEVWKEACAEGLSHLVNCFEDPRQERELINKFQFGNARNILAALTSYCAKMGTPDPRCEDQWGYCVNLMAYHALYGNLGDQVAEMLDGIPPDTLAIFERAVAEIAAAENTQDILETARWFADLAGKQVAPEPPEGEGEGEGPTPPKSDDEFNDDDREDEGQGEGQGEGESEDGDVTEEDGQGGPSNREGEGEGEGQGQGGASDQEGEGGGSGGSDQEGEGRPEGEGESEGPSRGYSENGDAGSPLDDKHIAEHSGRDIGSLVDEIVERHTMLEGFEEHGVDIGVMNPNEIFMGILED